MSYNKINDIRDEYDLTQQELANIIGGSRVNISNWENDKEIPNIQRINVMVDYFDISLDYIFKLSHDKTYKDIRKGYLDRVITGKRLKQVREGNNLTLKSLANELNTTSSTLSAYETGKNMLLTAFAIQICKKYRISMDWLYGKID
ncbi:MAG: helix-turn-helix transcriptional regulator [Bacilli bacterium]|nr:helix-turn-helix transcriptional regulator [Bacilli bacterium]